MTTRVRLNGIGPWLAELRYVWLASVVAALALIVAAIGGTEPAIRLTGLVLQLLGIGTVIWGIVETRALFGHPAIFAKTKHWLGRFPLLKQSRVVSAQGVAVGTATGRARAMVTHGPIAKPTVEARLDALEKNVIAIHHRITETQREFDADLGSIERKLAEEAMKRESEDTNIRGTLEATGTEGVHISAIGAAWLFVGVVLSTAAMEIEKWLR